MTHCPSQDWDRYIDAQDAAADAEIAFYAEHGATIERIAIALIRAGRLLDGTATAERELVRSAASIAQLIYIQPES